VIGKNLGSDNIGINLFMDRFNHNLLRQLFVVCNELPQLTSTSRNSVFDTLKSAITDDDRTYEIKGGRKWSGPNYVNCICTTNHDFTYNIEQNDGRILALKCSPRYARNFEYFTELNKNLQQDNADHLITFLYERKITHDLRDIPMTQLKKEMIELSLTTPIRFVNSIKEESDLINDLLHRGVNDVALNDSIKLDINSNKIKSSSLYLLYMQWCKERGENTMSQTAFSRILKNDCNIPSFKSDFIFFEKFW